MKKLYFVLLVLILISTISCNKKKKYQADWIIVKAEYKGESILEYIGFRNFTIDFDNEVGGIPIVHYGKFDETDITYERNFSFYKYEGKDYIQIIGSKFFTDTFEIKCLNEECCTITLKNKDKYIELIYNSGLSPLYDKRKDCPSALERLDY